MKPHYSIFLLSLLFSVIFFSSGCATTENENNEKINVEARIKNAEAVKASLLKELDNPKDVNEIVIIKDQLAQVQEEIDSLQAGKTPEELPEKEQADPDGFKDTKDRTITYGPLGFVLQLTQFVLEKLYIIHEN
jgi:hypothetical protein